MRPGVWWIRSASDPRWRADGRANLVGMFARPAEVDAEIARLSKLYGDPPTDLEWGYQKD